MEVGRGAGLGNGLRSLFSVVVGVVGGNGKGLVPRGVIGEYLSALEEDRGLVVACGLDVN